MQTVLASYFFCHTCPLNKTILIYIPSPSRISFRAQFHITQFHIREIYWSPHIPYAIISREIQTFFTSDENDWPRFSGDTLLAGTQLPPSADSAQGRKNT